MAKLTVQVRTRHSLPEILDKGESPAWVVGQDKITRITHVRIVNLDGTQAIEGIFDPSSKRRDDGRLILRFSDGHMVNCDIQFDSRNPVRYIQG